MLRRTRTRVIVVAFVGSIAVAGTPPEGFVDAIVVDGASATGAQRPTAIAYEPGSGDLWVLEKGPGSENGSTRIRVRDEVTAEIGTAHTLDCVDSRGERGLLGIAFSPDYLGGPSTRHVYLFYTRVFAGTGECNVPGRSAGTRIRVSRFLVGDDGLSGEDVVYETPSLGSRTNHNGGTIRFSSDGMLWISIGDNDTDADPNPLSRELGDPRGKLLRIRGDGSVPSDNPFVGQPGVLPEIWAWGLRNPFRFSVDSVTRVPFIADVGEARWEAVYVGVAGADYGYPCVEGNEPFRTCDPAPPAGSVTEAAYVYGHGSQTPPVSGRSITGGPVYRAETFPEDYQGNYYFADFSLRWIRRALVTSGPGLSDVEMFIPDAGQVVDMIVSPEGCLTYADFSSGVHEVCYSGDLADQDGDGFSVALGDCDDRVATTFPGAPDVCDGVDNSCSGTADDDVCSRYDAVGDARVDGQELTWLGRAFGACDVDPSAQWWAALDFTLDGCVDGDDLSVLATVWSCVGTTATCE